MINIKTYSSGGIEAIAVYDAASNCLSIYKKIKILIISLNCKKKIG